MQWNVNSDGRCKVKQNTSQRDKKGNSIIAFPDEFVMVDIETTGCDTRYNEIIEISAIRVKDDQVIDRFSKLICPWNDIDPFITNLTGITNQMVQDAPQVGEVIKQFLRFIRPDDILLGYNVNFDINFLYDNALSEADYYLSNDFIDVLRIARKLIKNTENHKLKTIAAYYDLSYVGAHRGEQDCIICLECFKQLRSELDKQSMSEADFIDSFNKRSSNRISTNHVCFSRETIPIRAVMANSFLSNHD
jgi:DNA polymerase-3 subunit epsilon